MDSFGQLLGEVKEIKKLLEELRDGFKEEAPETEETPTLEEVRKDFVESLEAGVQALRQAILTENSGLKTTVIKNSIDTLTRVIKANVSETCDCPVCQNGGFVRELNPDNPDDQRIINQLLKLKES